MRVSRSPHPRGLDPADASAPAKTNANATSAAQGADAPDARDGRLATREHPVALEPPFGLELRALTRGLTAVGLGLLLLTAGPAGLPGPALGALRAPALGAPLVAEAKEPAAVAGQIVASEKNAYVPGSAAAERPLPPLEGLKRLGYLVRPVASLTVLDSVAASHPDLPLARQKVGQGGYDAVVNGGFYFGSKGALHAAGAVVRHGQLDSAGVDKAKHRGAIAIRTDGTVVIGRQHGATLAALEARFGPLAALMGGGALLLEDGQKVSSADLGRAASAGGQQFDQSGRGLAAEQMRRTYHTVLAIRDGQLFLVGAVDKTGTQIRDQLFDAGFDSAVKLDGGSGGYFREARGTRAAGLAPLGFGIHFRR